MRRVLQNSVGVGKQAGHCGATRPRLRRAAASPVSALLALLMVSGSSALASAPYQAFVPVPYLHRALTVLPNMPTVPRGLHESMPVYGRATVGDAARRSSSRWPVCGVMPSEAPLFGVGVTIGPLLTSAADILTPPVWALRRAAEKKEDKDLVPGRWASRRKYLEARRHFTVFPVLRALPGAIGRGGCLAHAGCLRVRALLQ